MNDEMFDLNCFDLNETLVLELISLVAALYVFRNLSLWVPVGYSFASAWDLSHISVGEI